MTGEATPRPGVGALEVATRSGSVVVRARAVTQPEVLRGAATIGADGVVRAPPSGSVEIACPEGTDVVIGSSSGRIECHGRLGRVAVTGASGRISIEAAREVDVRTASGKVTVGVCEGLCRVTTRSGGIRIRSAAAIDVTLSSGRLEAEAIGDAQVRSGSGRVSLGLERPGSVEVSSLSGRVTVTLAAGVRPALHLVSRSGRVRSEVDAGTDGNLSIESLSGAIKVTRA